MGWYLNYAALPHEIKAPKWLAVNTVTLMAFIAVAFLTPLRPTIPLQTALLIVMLFDTVFVFAILAITIIEAKAVFQTSNPNSKFFKSVGWNQLKGKSQKFVLWTFLFFNYQEMAIGIFGVTFTFLVHTFI